MNDTNAKIDQAINDTNAKIDQAINDTHIEVTKTIDNTGMIIRNELWLWRSIMIFLTLLLLITILITDTNDRNRNAADNKERARAWTQIEANQARIMSQNESNADLLLKIDEQMQRYISSELDRTGREAAKLLIRNKSLDAAQKERDVEQNARDDKAKKK
jgi:hypothetical protein